MIHVKMKTVNYQKMILLTTATATTITTTITTTTLTLMKLTTMKRGGRELATLKKEVLMTRGAK